MSMNVAPPDPDTPGEHTGRLFAGTSGFSYPDWAPRFYPAGTRSADLLPAYAARLAAVELNNTFYRHPSPATIEGWLAATPESFRFAIKAQRGGSFRALTTDPAGSLDWLLPPYRRFGERLGTVLFRVPDPVARDDDRLDRLLEAWPVDLPLTMEFQHPSWLVDEVIERMRAHGAILCATDLDDLSEPPPLILTGPSLYLRLRRTDYDEGDLDAWAERVAPFLDAGHDAFVFFRHDADGTSALRAAEFARRVAARGPSATNARD
jgi:uncharacterized protein YecE (DUF72 family)